MEDKNQNGPVIFPGQDANTTSGRVSFFRDTLAKAQSLEPVTDESAQVEGLVSNAPAKTEKKFLHLAKRADVILALLLVLGGVGLALNAYVAEEPTAKNVVSQFETTELPLNDFITPQGVSFDSQSVIINGSLQAKDGLIIAPTTQPTSAVAGQMYYDQTANVLSYYNGAQFVSLSGASGVQSIGGLSGEIGVASGLSVTGGLLNNTGVLTVQGQSGAVTFTGGSGITVDGTRITNTGVIDVVSSSSTIVVSKDSNGVVTLSGSGAGTVSSPGGTSGTVPLFTAAQTIENSIITQAALAVTVTGDLNVASGNLTLANALTVANGGTGATSLTANGVLVGQGTAAISSVAAAGPGLCLQSTAGAPAFAACPGGGGVTSLNGLTGALTVANASAAGSTVTLNDASTAQKGIAQFNATNFSASGGVINTTQDINTSASPTFNNITASGDLAVNGGDIQSTSTLTIGTSGAGNDITIDGADQFIVQDAAVFNGLSTFNTDVDMVFAETENLNIVSTVTGTNSVALLSAVLTNNTSSGTQQMALLQNASGSGTTDALLVLDNADTDTSVTNGLQITSAAGGIATAIDVSDPDIVTALLFGSNDIDGDNFDIVGATGAFTTASNATIQGGTVTLGTTSTAGSLVVHDGNGQTATLGVADLGGNRNLTIPAATANDTFCLLTLANCVGTGGGVSGTGNQDRLAKFTTTGSTIGDSTITDNGSTVSTTVDFVVQGGELTVGTAAQTASLLLHDGNGQSTTLQAGNSGSNLTFILPTNTGSANQCLKQSGTGNQLFWESCDGGGGGSSATLQTAYSNGATAIITTSDNRDIDIVLSNDTTDANFDLVVADGSTGFVSFTRADGSGTADPAQLLLIDNLDATRPVPVGIKLQASGGGLTVALDASDNEIGTALSVGANTIAGTTGDINFDNFDVVGASGNTTIGGTLDVTGTTALAGTLNANGNTALGNAAADTLTVAATIQGTTPFVFEGGTADAHQLSFGIATLDGDRTVTFGNETGTVCLQNSTNCGFAATSGSGSYIQNQIAAQQSSSNFWISSTGRADVAFLTPLLDTATAGTLTIGGTATGVTISENTTINGTATDALVVKSSGNGSGAVILNLQQSDSDSVFRMTDTGTLAIGNATNVAGILAIGNGTGADFVEIKVDNVTASQTIQLPNASGTVCLSSGNCASTDTLQTAYTASTGGTTPEIKLDTGRNGIEIQDANTTIGSGQNFISLRGPNASGLGTVLFGVGTQGNLYMMPSTNRVDLVDINQNSSGTASNVFTIDSLTSTGRVGIALTSTNNPAYTLDVGGDTNLASGSTFRINGTAICTSSGCTPAAGSANYIQNQSAAQQSSSSFWISNSGRADASFLTPAVDTAAAGALSVGTTTATSVTLGGNTNTPITLNSGTGTIAIGTGAQARAINLGTGAADQDVTIGSTTTGSSLNLNASSGNMVLNATSGTVTVQTTTSGAINIRPASVDGTNIVLGTSDNVGTVLVLDEKTGSGDPSAAAGGMYYNSSMGRMRCHFDGKWRFCNDPVGLTWGYDWREDFISGNNVSNTGSVALIGEQHWLEDKAGTGAGFGGDAPDSSSRIGQIHLDTGTTTTGRDAIYINASGGQEPMIFGGGEEIEMAINIATAANVTDDYVMRLGFCDESDGTDCTDGLYFEYNRATSGNWIICAAKGGTRTKTTSGTAVTTGAWLRLKMVVNAAATQIDFYVDGTNIGNIAATNLPTSGTNTTQPEFVISKTAGTNSRTFKIDYFQVRNSFTTPR